MRFRLLSTPLLSALLLSTATTAWLGSKSPNSKSSSGEKAEIGVKRARIGPVESREVELQGLLTTMESSLQQEPKPIPISNQSCFFRALSSLPSNSEGACESMGRDEMGRMEMATRMAICEISIGFGGDKGGRRIPKECVDWETRGIGALVGACVEALARSPQHWSSYSGYLREIVTLCSAYRRWADLEAARTAYSSTSSTLSNFVELLKSFEVARARQQEAHTSLMDQKLENFSNFLQQLNNLSDQMQSDHHSQRDDISLAENSLSTSLAQLDSLFSNKLGAALDSLLSTYRISVDSLSDGISVELRRVVETHANELSIQSVALSSSLENYSLDLKLILEGLDDGLHGLESRIDRASQLTEKTTAALDSMLSTGNSLQHSLEYNIGLSQHLAANQEYSIATLSSSLFSLGEHINNLTDSMIVQAEQSRNENSGGLDFWWILSLIFGIYRGGIGWSGIFYSLLSIFVGREFAYGRILTLLSLGIMICPFLFRIFMYARPISGGERAVRLGGRVVVPRLMTIGEQRLKRRRKFSRIPDRLLGA